MTKIGLPTDTQIKAAIELFNRIENLKRNDDILKDLKGQATDPYDFYGTLLQALAVNEFYSARYPDVYRVARWISDNRVMQYNRGDDASRIKLVTNIATLEGQIKGDGWPVFASKFAHFFIDAETFPILDKRAEEMVLIHLGRLELYPESNASVNPYKTGQRYQEFYKNFCSLKEAIDSRTWQRVN